MTSRYPPIDAGSALRGKCPETPLVLCDVLTRTGRPQTSEEQRHEARSSLMSAPAHRFAVSLAFKPRGHRGGSYATGPVEAAAR